MPRKFPSKLPPEFSPWWYSPWWVVALLVAWFVALIAFDLFVQRAEGAELTDAVVRVRSGDSGGSGTLIWKEGDEGLILTAAHVVGVAVDSPAYRPEATATWHNGHASTGKVIYYDVTNDAAAFLVTPPDDCYVLPLGNANVPTAGDVVQAIGFGGGRFQVRELGVHGYDANLDWIRTAPGTQSGDSGGPFVYHNTVAAVISGGELEAGPRSPVLRDHGGSCRPIRNALAKVFPRITYQQHCPSGGCPPAMPLRYPTYPPRAMPEQPQRRPPPAIPQRAVDLAPLIGRIEGLERKTVDLSPFVDRLDAMEQQIAGIQLIPGPPGERGPPGNDGQDAAPVNVESADPDAIVGLLVERIKADTALQEALRGPPGRDGSDGADGRDGTDGSDGGDGSPGLPPPPQSGVTHAVVVVDRNASWWPRLATQVERARDRFAPIELADPPKFATELPALVFYSAGKPILWRYGERDVTRALESLQRGDLDFLTRGS